MNFESELDLTAADCFEFCGAIQVLRPLGDFYGGPPYVTTGILNYLRGFGSRVVDAIALLEAGQKEAATSRVKEENMDNLTPTDAGKAWNEGGAK